MGGEGSMASAILSLKQNRALLKKRNIRELKDLLREKSGKTELEFKKVSTAELAKMKEKIRKEAKKNAQKEIILFLILFAITAAIVVYLIDLAYSALTQ